MYVKKKIHSFVNTLFAHTYCPLINVALVFKQIILLIKIF